MANDDIDAVAIFPGDVDVSSGFPSSRPMKILLGFRNNGESPVNVTHIAGSLNAANSFAFYVTNFTTVGVFTTVEPGKEASFEYPFVLDKELAGHSFRLAVTAFYADETESYASTFYNRTIAVNDPVGVFDTQTFVVKLVLLALVLAVVYAGLVYAGAAPALEKQIKKALGKGKKQPKQVKKLNKAEDRDEWLKGTAWKDGKGQ